MKLTLKNFSIVSLCLMGVSTIATAFTSTKEVDEQNGAFAAGIAQLSSGGSAFSAVPGAGVASYTITIGKTGGLSATGAGILTLTANNGNDTGRDTTRNG